MKIQWVVHTPEWELETLVSIFGLDRTWVREKEDGRNHNKNL